MSWEVMSDREETCSCGKGKIRIIHKMDDWNRSENYEEILCDECKKGQ